MNQIAASRQSRLIVGLSVLIALLLVGGAIAVWIYGSLRQQWAIKELSGGSHTVHSVATPSGPLYFIFESPVYYDYELGSDAEPIAGVPPGPEWLRDWLGVDFFATVRGVELDNFRVDARALVALSGLRRFKTSGNLPLDLSELVPGSPELERLELQNVDVSSDELAALATLHRLRFLVMVDCPMLDNTGLWHLSKITSLEELTLQPSDEAINAGLAKIGRLTNLEKLNLTFGQKTSDAVLKQLSGLHRLHDLTLNYHPADAARGLKYLDRFKSLTKLTINDTEVVTDHALAELPELPTLEELTLSGCRQLHAAGLANLRQLVVGAK